MIRSPRMPSRPPSERAPLLPSPRPECCGRAPTILRTVFIVGMGAESALYTLYSFITLSCIAMYFETNLIISYSQPPQRPEVHPGRKRSSFRDIARRRGAGRPNARSAGLEPQDGPTALGPKGLEDAI